MRALFMPVLPVLLCVGAVGCTPDDEGDDDDAPRAPFAITAFQDARITSDGAAPNFQKIVTDIDVGDGPFAAVTLTVDLATTCFPFEAWADDPPPAGHNFPPLCDAFDRNFHFTLDEVDGAVPFELVRAITPFGGPLHLEIDLTDLLNAHPGAHTLTAHITTFADGAGLVSGSNGGWNVSAVVDVVPGAAPRAVLGAVPLVFDNLVADRNFADAAFAPPAGTARTRVEVRATGHGGPQSDVGCIGPAEEFCERSLDVVVVGSNVEETFSPWLDSCEDFCTLTTGPGPFGGTLQYCAESPTGAIESVRAPRANWCPGRVTPPFVVDGDLGTGDRFLQLGVAPRIAPGGSWFVSATAIFYADDAGAADDDVAAP